MIAFYINLCMTFVGDTGHHPGKLTLQPKGAEVQLEYCVFLFLIGPVRSCQLRFRADAVLLSALALGCLFSPARLPTQWDSFLLPLCDSLHLVTTETHLPHPISLTVNFSKEEEFIYTWYIDSNQTFSTPVEFFFFFNEMTGSSEDNLVAKPMGYRLKNKPHLCKPHVIYKCTDPVQR